MRSLFQARAEKGSGTILWNGRDERGSPLPAGVYAVRLDYEHGNRRAGAKLPVLLSR